MKTHITQEDIIRYIYKETSDVEGKLILEYINKNRAAKLFYLETIETVSKLNGLDFEPNNTSINIIMESISKSSTFEESV